MASHTSPTTKVGYIHCMYRLRRSVSAARWTRPLQSAAEVCTHRVGCALSLHCVAVPS